MRSYQAVKHNSEHITEAHTGIKRKKKAKQLICLHNWTAVPFIFKHPYCSWYLCLPFLFPLSPAPEQLPYLCETCKLQHSLGRCLTQAGADWDVCMTRLCKRQKWQGWERDLDKATVSVQHQWKNNPGSVHLLQTVWPWQVGETSGEGVKQQRKLRAIPPLIHLPQLQTASGFKVSACRLLNTK